MLDSRRIDVKGRLWLSDEIVEAGEQLARLAFLAACQRTKGETRQHKSGRHGEKEQPRIKDGTELQESDQDDSGDGACRHEGRV